MITVKEQIILHKYNIEVAYYTTQKRVKEK